LEQLVAITRIPMNAVRIAVIEGQSKNSFIYIPDSVDFSNYTNAEKTVLVSMNGEYSCVDGHAPVVVGKMAVVEITAEVKALYRTITGQN